MVPGKGAIKDGSRTELQFSQHCKSLNENISVLPVDVKAFLSNVDYMCVHSFSDT